jgi:hypothetical protein
MVIITNKAVWQLISIRAPIWCFFLFAYKSGEIYKKFYKNVEI